jgi:hypothetical protein
LRTKIRIIQKNASRNAKKIIKEMESKLEWLKISLGLDDFMLFSRKVDKVKSEAKIKSYKILDDAHKEIIQLIKSEMKI